MSLTRRQFIRASGIFGLAALAGCQSFHAAKNRQKTNILLIMADDMGFSDAGCYGGDVRTPVLNGLAENGLRFTQHYSAGRCWPSRACILSGYYAQHIRRDSLGPIKLEKRPDWGKLLPEFLKQQGYRTYHSGKWHIDGTPMEGGFERSWGWNDGGCDWDRYFDSQPWQEGRYRAPVEKGQPYYSTVAIADHAIACLKLHHEKTPDQPFFQYLAFYSPHFPLHALKKDIESYKGAYDQGWDVIRQQRFERMKKMGIFNCKLSPREPEVIPGWNLEQEQLEEQISPNEVGKAAAWDDLTEDQKRFQAVKMEIHAAMISRMDAEIGRVIEQLKAMGQYENTLILFVSDNGASAEQINRGDKHHQDAFPGSAESYLCLGPGWSTAANTPFRYHKYWNHEGGISSPMIAHWPAGIKGKNQLRHDPSHFIDIAPTIMDVAGGKMPDFIDGTKVPKRPGKSLLDAFDKGRQVRHESLWWYHRTNRAIRMGDWKLSARTNGPWELYNMNVDRSETNNLALRYPKKVKYMDRRWNEIADNFYSDLGLQDKKQ